MKHLSSSKFTAETHVGLNGYSINSLWDFNKHCPKKHWGIIGWCDARNIPYRDKEDGYVIMLERISADDWENKNDIGENIWLHIRWRSKKDFEDFIRTKQGE